MVAAGTVNGTPELVAIHRDRCGFGAAGFAPAGRPSSPSLRLRAHLEPGRLEQARQVEADDRLVLGDQDSHAGKTTSAREAAARP